MSGSTRGGMAPSAEESKKANAELAAAKAKAKSLRPWYQKKRFVIPIGLFMFSVFANLVNPSDTAPSQSSLGENSKATAEDTPAKPVAPWYPSGFTELTPTVAYKPFEVEDMDCGYSGAHSCYQIYVVANLDCNLYMDVNFLKNSVVVDDSIDSATVQAGELAILSFTSFDAAQYSGDTKVKITDVTCY